jgi:DNA-binding MarR family transcriptional regulator
MAASSNKKGLDSPTLLKSTKSKTSGTDGTKISNMKNKSSESHVRYDLKILLALRRIIRAVDIYSRKLKSECDLTAPQLICLLELVETGPLTATQISQLIHVSPSTVVGVLDRLEKKGLIQRDRSSKDRRQVHVTATENGRTVASDAPSPLQEGLANALKKLPELEQATIALSLERIVELMEAREIEAAPILETGQAEQSL